MSEQPPQTRACPTCGNAVPVMARYCPSCGTRLDPGAVYSADDFEDALEDIFDAPADEPTTQPTPSFGSPESPSVSTPVDSTSEPAAQPEWTAQASDWSEPVAQPGTWTAQPPIAVPAKSRGSRKLWITLAILGFVVFCCCGSFFALLLVAESDTAFRHEFANLTFESHHYLGG